MTGRLVFVLAAILWSTASAGAQTPAESARPRPPGSGVGVLGEIQGISGVHVGAIVKLNALAVDVTGGAVLIHLGATSDGFEVAKSFSVSGRARYLPFVRRRGAIGGSLGVHYNTVLGSGVSGGPEMEFYLQDWLSARVGSALELFPNADENILERFGPTRRDNSWGGRRLGYALSAGLIFYL